MARLLVSATAKSSGKTTLSIGLAAALSARGRRVQTFKKGPDYIDPMWLAAASGRPCYNLDFNTQTHEEIETMAAGMAAGADIALIEGNKGLHDGVDLEGADSTAALARLVGAPVILVVEASGMTRGIAPLVRGQVDFDPAVRVAGVILNRVAGARQESKLRRALERYTDVAILGAVGRMPAALVRERHLGLTTPAETDGAARIVAALGRIAADNVDVARAAGIAATAPAWPRVAPASAPARGRAGDVRIGVARDAAFAFYYPDDLDALARAGAELVFFAPLTDQRLPEVDALFIGGGFPETHLAALEANGGLRRDIAGAARAGLPVYAECGGLMYLTRAIAWRGETREMVGLLPADTVVGARPQGRGLMVLEETGLCPWSGDGSPVAAHEFHYARLANLAPGQRFAYRVARGHGIDGRHDGLLVANTLASFAHLRDTARHRWAGRFVAFARAARDAHRLFARPA